MPQQQLFGKALKKAARIGELMEFAGSDLGRFVYKSFLAAKKQQTLAKSNFWILVSHVFDRLF